MSDNKVKLAILFLGIGSALGGAGWAGSGKFEDKPTRRAQAPLVKDDRAANAENTPARDLYGDPLPDGAVARLGTVRFNHGHSLNSLYFSPDGKTLVSEGSGVIRIWDAASGEERQHIVIPTPPHFADTGATVLSEDGRYLIFTQQEGKADTVRTWDLVHGREARVAVFPVRRSLFDYRHRNALSPDGRLCAVNTQDDIRVFDVAEAKELWRIPNRGQELGLVIYAGDRWLVTTNKYQRTHVREARTGKLLHEFEHGSTVQVMAASTDGSRLATCEQDVSPNRVLIHVWDLSTGRRLQKLEGPLGYRFTEMRFAPDGTGLFASGFREKTGGDTSVAIHWDTVSGKQLREFEGGPVLAVSRDGRRVALGGARIKLVEVDTGKTTAFDESREAWALEAFLSTAGDRAFTIDRSSIREWDVASCQRRHRLDVPHFAYSRLHSTHSPDGRYAATFKDAHTTLIWDVVNRKRLCELRSTGMEGGFSQDSTLFASDKVWDIRTGKEVSPFKAPEPVWSGVPFFAGKTLTYIGRVVVGFDFATGRELFSWQLKPVPNAPFGYKPGFDYLFAWRSLAISPDGTVVGGILDGNKGRRPFQDRIILCDAKTGKILGRMNDSGIIPMPEEVPEAVAFSPDSRLFATSDNNVIHLWEVASRKEVRSFSGHRGDIHSLSFSLNGRRLISSSNDSTCLIWDLQLSAGVAEPLAKAPSEKELAIWWDDLAKPDARRAYAAIWRLAEAPKQAVPFLGQRLHPVTDHQVKQIPQHVADLESKVFAARQSAFQSLNTLGPPAEGALRRALANNPSLEARLRLEQLLKNLNGGRAAGEPLRSVRAVAALEQAGTQEAQRLLQSLAEGVDGAWLTNEAKGAVARLATKATY